MSGKATSNQTVSNISISPYSRLVWHNKLFPRELAVPFVAPAARRLRDAALCSRKQVLAGAVGRPRIASRRRRCRWKMGVSKQVDSCHKHDHMGRHGTCTGYLSCLLMFSMSPNNLDLSVGGCQDGWVPFYCGNACFITSMLSIQPILNFTVFTLTAYCC